MSLSQYSVYPVNVFDYLSAADVEQLSDELRKQSTVEAARINRCSYYFASKLNPKAVTFLSHDVVLQPPE